MLSYLTRVNKQDDNHDDDEANEQGSDVGEEETETAQYEKDQSKRFEYLLSQTEGFAQFLACGDAGLGTRDKLFQRSLLCLCQKCCKLFVLDNKTPSSPLKLKEKRRTLSGSQPGTVFSSRTISSGDHRHR